MTNYTEIDKIFGPPVPMTTRGKLANISTSWYIAGGIILIAAAIGVVSITKTYYPSAKKSEDKK